MGCCGSSDFTPAADTTASASQRVNYSFGMVLGVDDFRQEHAWLAGRDQRALRETIGYGVLAGLEVGVEPAAAGGADFVVKVMPGLALAPDGQLVAVTREQCASLAGWLAGAGHQSPPAAGTVTACVVLAYDETLDTPVPIPGEPCRDESAQQAYARWTDAFRLALVWPGDAPRHAEQAALQRYVRWLRAIPVRDSGAGTLGDFVAALEAAWTAGETASPPSGLVIPHGEVPAWLQAAFDLWAHRLRLSAMAPFGPLAGTEAGVGDAERSLVLARLTFTLGPDGQLRPAPAPQVLREDRPTLVHLRMLQEWLLSDAEDDAPYDARYVLGAADARLPRAQDLRHDFFDPALGHAAGRPGEGGLPGRVSAPAAGPLARVDLAGRGTHAVLAPAVKWPGSADAPADYYGPAMTRAIPVADGGTGLKDAPGDGQLLVGRGGGYALGRLHGKGETPSIVVDAPASGGAADIAIDTVQPLHATAEPAFAGLALTGRAGSPPGPALQVAGGAALDALQIDALGPALLGADAEHRVVAAERWDGTLAAAGAVPRYYGPGQAAPVRIADGGTGLAELPAPMQLLIGHGEGRAGAYVLAELKAGPNASIALEAEEAPLEPRLRQRRYTLTIDARGGGGTAVQAAADGNITVALQEGTATLDTVTTPHFANVQLTDPASAMTHRVGWDEKTRLLGVTDAPPRLRVRVAPRQADARIAPTDELLLLTGDLSHKVVLPPPAEHDGRQLIVKAAGTIGSAIVGETDLGDLTLSGTESVTVVASREAGRWLVVSLLTRR